MRPVSVQDPGPKPIALSSRDAELRQPDVGEHLSVRGSSSGVVAEFHLEPRSGRSRAVSGDPAVDVLEAELTTNQFRTMLYSGSS